MRRDRRKAAPPKASPATLFGSNLSAWYDRGFGVTYGSAPNVASLLDRSGNGNTLSQGTGAQQPDLVGTGLDFVAANSDFLQAADANSLDATTLLVVGLAFTPDVVASGFPLSKGTNYAVQLSLAADFYYTGGSNFIARSTTAIAAGTDYRLIMAYDGSQGSDATRLRMWINGVQSSWSFAFGAAIPATLAANATALYLGSFNGAGSFFDGRIRAAVIARQAMTDQMVTTLDGILSKS